MHVWRKLVIQNVSTCTLNWQYPDKSILCFCPKGFWLLSAELPICKLSRTIEKDADVLSSSIWQNQWMKTRNINETNAYQRNPTNLILCNLFARLCPKKMGEKRTEACSAQHALQCSVIKTSRWLLSESFIQRCLPKFIITQKANRIWWNESRSDVKIPTLRSYAVQGIVLVWSNFIFLPSFLGVMLSVSKAPPQKK